jgi:hypothetical protein
MKNNIIPSFRMGFFGWACFLMSSCPYKMDSNFHNPYGEDIKSPLRDGMRTSILVQGYVVEIKKASLFLLSFE